MKKRSESKSLREVRTWKKSVAASTKKLRGKAILDYFSKGVKTAKNKKAA